MNQNNKNLHNLFIIVEYLNHNYINLEFTDYLKKNTIYLSYNSPSFFLDGIYLKFTSNKYILKKNSARRSSKSPETPPLEKKIPPGLGIEFQKINITNKNKTIKNTKINLNNAFKIEIILNTNDLNDNLLIEKLLECNNKILNIIYRYNGR